MNYAENAFTYLVAEESVLGIVTMPERSNATGVLIAVGGPQYRLGCHRQFLLLARALAKAGYPVMRFDYRGMGTVPANCEALKRSTRTLVPPLIDF